MEHQFFVPSSNGALIDARVLSLDSKHPNAKIGIILTHPYALLGGNMHNNVVVELYKKFAKLGFTVCRMDFRGVGKSKGRGSWRGEAERDDIKSVAKCLLKRNQPQLQDSEKSFYEEITVKNIILIGYSYGSGISSSCVNDLDEILGYVAISYPFGPYFFLYCGNSSLLTSSKSKKPKLFIMGDKDNFTSTSKFWDRMENFSGDKSDSLSCEIVPGIDHFWFGKEDILLDIIFKWMEKKFQIQDSVNKE